MLSMSNFIYYLFVLGFILCSIFGVQSSVSWLTFMGVWKKERTTAGEASSTFAMISDFCFGVLSDECKKYKASYWRAMRRAFYTIIVLLILMLIYNAI